MTIKERKFPHHIRKIWPEKVRGEAEDMKMFLEKIEEDEQ